MSYSVPTVLTIAGSDSSGGAGVQADLKTIESFGLFGQSAITSLTAQNTLGVNAVFDASPEFVEAQIDAVFDDMVPDAVKIGMISSSAIAEAVARALRRRAARHIVVDPVMVATSGADLMRDGAVRAVVGDLFPLAEVITPNLSEARALCGFDIVDAAGMERAARMLAGMTSGAVLVKGGHLDESADDCLVFDGRTCWLRGTRIDTGNTHGTGCTLSSAIACASRRPMWPALFRAAFPWGRGRVRSTICGVCARRSLRCDRRAAGSFGMRGRTDGAAMDESHPGEHGVP